MASGEPELTHNEIWDDSALIDSWEQALDEYKKYHSIHRNGGNVNDLLKIKTEEVQDAKQNSHQIDETANDRNPETDAETAEDKLESDNIPTQHGQQRASGAPPAPAGLLGTVRDEGLKKLLMSWYYAGYYTGYYEGQRDSPQNRDALQ